MARTKKSTYERLMSGPLNRQQRRELARRLKTEDPGLEIVNRNVAGIDVGNESHFVAVASKVLGNSRRAGRAKNYVMLAMFTKTPSPWRSPPSAPASGASGAARYPTAAR